MQDKQKPPIRIERFVYASFPASQTNRAGYKLYPSMGLNQFITSDERRILQLQSCKQETETCTPLSDGKIAFSYLKPIMDEAGRDSFYNFTIIISILDLLDLLNAKTMLSPYIIRDMEHAPNTPFLSTLFIEREKVKI